jgi:hypothetical protein
VEAIRRWRAESLTSNVVPMRTEKIF